VGDIVRSDGDLACRAWRLGMIGHDSHDGEGMRQHEGWRSVTRLAVDGSFLERRPVPDIADPLVCVWRGDLGDAEMPCLMSAWIWSGSTTDRFGCRAGNHLVVARLSPRAPLPSACASKKNAAVAVGHSIVVIAWHLLTDNRDYQDLGGDYFVRRDTQRQRQRTVAHLQALGYRVVLEPAAT
jgi:hypothetical protein